MKKLINSLLIILMVVILIPTTSSGQKWQKVSAGGQFSAALRSDGTIWECGRARLGELGNGGDTSYVYSFSQTGTDTDWVDISCGVGHVLALKRDGTLWAWGNNANGELGLGDSINRKYPQQINTDNDWVFISASSYASYAIKKDGSIWGWGFNVFGNIDSDRINRAVPEEMDNKYKWKKIEGGYSYTIALRQDGSLWGLGWNGAGQLGIGTTVNSKVLARLNNDADWVDVCSGWFFNIALKKNGTIWSWGDNENGQLGQGNVSPLSSPKQISIDSDWAQICAGSLFAYGIKKNGTLWGWGWNGYGNLGTGNTNEFNYPYKNNLFQDWRMISGSKGYRVNGYIYGLHTLAVRGDSSIICVTGQNDYGQLGTGNSDPVNSFNCSIYAGIPGSKTVGIDDIKLFPNPASESVSLSLPGNLQSEYNITVFDLNGKPVMQSHSKFMDDKIQLDISNITRGMYVVEIVSDSGIWRTKLVKN